MKPEMLRVVCYAGVSRVTIEPVLGFQCIRYLLLFSDDLADIKQEWLYLLLLLWRSTIQRAHENELWL